MIDVGDDCEFATLIAELIKTLSAFDKGLFVLKVWVTGTELPFIFENHCDFLFLQEGIRITDKEDVLFLWYDTIAYIRVINESKRLKQ